LECLGYFGYVVFCYVLGWFMTGYFVVRLLAEKDIRSEGSGNMGALNSGRIVGKKGFALTFFGDFLKGGLAVVVGFMLNFPEWVVLSGFIAVIAGHIWPVPFKFCGGKGAAAFLGGLIIYSPYSLLFLIILTALFYLLLKEFTAAGLAAVLFWPFFQLFQGSIIIIFLLDLVLILIIILAHRTNIQAYRQRHFKGR